MYIIVKCILQLYYFYLEKMSQSISNSSSQYSSSYIASPWNRLLGWYITSRKTEKHTCKVKVTQKILFFKQKGGFGKGLVKTILEEKNLKGRRALLLFPFTFLLFSVHSCFLLSIYTVFLVSSSRKTKKAMRKGHT